MAEESIDFTQSSRRILLNPIVPLSMLDIACRTSERAQATLLGKVYSGHIEIVEVIPMQYSNVQNLDNPESEDRLSRAPAQTGFHSADLPESRCCWGHSDGHRREQP